MVLSEDQKRALIRFIEEHLQLIADNRALIAILVQKQMDRRLVTNWVADLERLRRSPEYHAILEDFESIASELEQEGDLDEAIRRLQKISEGKPPN